MIIIGEKSEWSGKSAGESDRGSADLRLIILEQCPLCRVNLIIMKQCPLYWQLKLT